MIFRNNALKIINRYILSEENCVISIGIHEFTR